MSVSVCICVCVCMCLSERVCQCVAALVLFFLLRLAGAISAACLSAESDRQLLKRVGMVGRMERAASQ